MYRGTEEERIDIERRDELRDRETDLMNAAHDYWVANPNADRLPEDMSLDLEMVSESLTAQRALMSRKYIEHQDDDFEAPSQQRPGM